MSGQGLGGCWSWVRSRANDVLVHAHKVLFVALAGVLAYAIYHLMQAVQTQTPPTSDWISIIALAASTYTAWYTHWLPPNVSVRLAWNGQKRSEHEKLELLFYNSGTSGTYLRIDWIRCANPRIEVYPTYILERWIEARGMQLIPIRLRPAEAGCFPQDLRSTEIEVAYKFWCGKQQVSREETIRVVSEERSCSHG